MLTFSHVMWNNLTLPTFVPILGDAMQGHLDQHEATRRAISRLASGAAFEAWLSFEMRLMLEARRTEFGLDDRCFIANEYRKVDLSITTEEDWLLCVEFKLIHNNKNWRTQCASVVKDLWPRPGTPKHEIEPMIGRLAALVVVGKVYRDPRGYPGQRGDLEAWESEMWSHLLREEAQIDRVWRSQRLLITGERLLVEDPGVKHFCEVHLLARATAGNANSR